MLIITIFISAYGIVSNAILYPNQPLNAKLLQDVFYDAWWSFLQQFNTDDALGKLFRTVCHNNFRMIFKQAGRLNYMRDSLAKSWFLSFA